jgi:hypothetical protein
MDKRRRQNLLLALAITILVIGTIIQVYYIVSRGNTSDTPDSTPQQIQPK